MKNNKKKGFTIVELVIVIAVIGILSAVLIPTFSNVTKNARESAKQQDLANARVAVIMAEDGAFEDGYTYYFSYEVSDGKFEYFTIEKNEVVEAEFADAAEREAAIADANLFKVPVVDEDGKPVYEEVDGEQVAKMEELSELGTKVRVYKVKNA